MAHYAFSSSSSNQVECPSSDYSEHYIWDYPYEALPLMPTNQTIGFAKQFSEIGKGHSKYGPPPSFEGTLEDSHDHHSEDSYPASMLALGPQLGVAPLSCMIQQYGTNQ
nr:hypothetical protein Itr_chr07CG11420 [Ipomoea trifida]